MSGVGSCCAWARRRNAPLAKVAADAVADEVADAVADAVATAAGLVDSKCA